MCWLPACQSRPRSVISGDLWYGKCGVLHFGGIQRLACRVTSTPAELLVAFASVFSQILTILARSANLPEGLYIYTHVLHSGESACKLPKSKVMNLLTGHTDRNTAVKITIHWIDIRSHLNFRRGGSSLQNSKYVSIHVACTCCLRYCVSVTCISVQLSSKPLSYAFVHLKPNCCIIN